MSHRYQQFRGRMSRLSGSRSIVVESSTFDPEDTPMDPAPADSNTIDVTGVDRDLARRNAQTAGALAVALVRHRRARLDAANPNDPDVRQSRAELEEAFDAFRAVSAQVSSQAGINPADRVPVQVFASRSVPDESGPPLDDNPDTPQPPLG